MPAGEGWNPWHGCHKCSEGRRYCSMDQKSGRSGADIYRTKIPTRSKKTGGANTKLGVVKCSGCA